MFDLPLSYMINRDISDPEVRRRLWDECARAGMKYLVLAAPWIARIMSSFPLVSELPQELAACGLELKDAHSPFGSLMDMNCPEPTLRPQMLLRQKLAIRIAADLGIKTITIHVGSDHLHPEIPLAHHLDRMREALDELLPAAEKAGIIICIENSLARAGCADNVIMLKSEYPTSSLGLCFDAGHANLMTTANCRSGNTSYERWKTAGAAEVVPDDRILQKMLPEIVNCHLHDNDGRSDLHALPGDGNINWDQLLPLLAEAPRLQVIQSEVKIFPGYTPEQTCRKFTELFERLK